MTLDQIILCPLYANTFEELDTIVTKEASCNSDTANDLGIDTEHKFSDNDLVLITALKEHINSLKRRIRNRIFDSRFIAPHTVIPLIGAN